MFACFVFLALFWFSFMFKYFSFRIHQFSFIFHAFFKHSSSGLFHFPLVFQYVPLVFHNVPLVFLYLPIFSTHVAVLFANSAGISNKRSCNTCTNGLSWFEQSQIYIYINIQSYQNLEAYGQIYMYIIQLAHVY